MIKFDVLHCVPVCAALVALSFGCSQPGDPTADTAPQVSVDSKAETASAASVVNGGFELGATGPDGWYRGNTVPGVELLWDNGAAHSGTMSLALKKSVQKYWPIADWRQDISVPPGTKEVQVSAWVRAESANKGVIDVQHPGGHEWAAYIGAKNDGDPPANHEWIQYSGTVALPAETKQITLALQIYGPGSLWFDDVTVEFSS